MTRNSILVAIMSLSLMNLAEAKCVAHPEIRASVTVEGCVGVTFSATDSKYGLGNGNYWSLYKAGDSLSGTLLTVSVNASHFVWAKSSDRQTNGAQLWNKGQLHSVFVRMPSSDVCPRVLPTALEIETQRVCCDSASWECLLPRTVALVSVMRSL